jgi:hypothetical protein
MTPSRFLELDAKLSPICVKREYVAIGGDIVVGSLLSQIVYWYRPGTNGKSKLRVYRCGQLWIAKTRDEWCRECCLSAMQYRRAIRALKAKGLIHLKVMRFDGTPTTHIRLDADKRGCPGNS